MTIVSPLFMYYIFILYWEFLGNDLEHNTVWDTDLGPRFGTLIWDRDLGPRFGTAIWDRDLGP
jgi:hypothetical protein